MVVEAPQIRVLLRTIVIILLIGLIVNCEDDHQQNQDGEDEVCHRDYLDRRGKQSKAVIGRGSNFKPQDSNFDSADPDRNPLAVVTASVFGRLVSR